MEDMGTMCRCRISDLPQIDFVFWHHWFGIIYLETIVTVMVKRIDSLRNKRPLERSSTMTAVIPFQQQHQQQESATVVIPPRILSVFLSASLSKQLETSCPP
jgi:hypothetical protein